jgi:hypothetical protein
VLTVLPLKVRPVAKFVKELNMALPLGFPALAAGMTGSALYGIKRVAEADEKKKNADKDKREAAAEIKRESRGVEKPANFDAMQESIQEAKDAKDRKKISDMGYARGGKVSSASSRADGCATKGKTKGTIVKMNYGGKC